MSPLLSMRSISKAFHHTKALEEVNFDIRAGEVHALLGENGAGKSTLVKILAGIYQKDRGEVLIKGRPVQVGSPAEAQACGIQMIHQELNLVEDLSVCENLFLNWRFLNRVGIVRWRHLRQKAREILEKIDPAIDPRATVRNLGIAQRQMIEIARSLVHEPDILILDEPTAVLTPSEAERLFNLMGALRTRGVGICFISHRLSEILRMGDRVTVLRDGRWIGTRLVTETCDRELVRMMVGREISQVFPRRNKRPGETVLRVRNLRTGLNREPISFDLRKGEILGIAGLVGSGRSRLVRALLGLCGLNGPYTSISSALKDGIAYAPEDRRRDGLVLDFSVARNVSLSNLERVSRHGLLHGHAEEAMAKEAIRVLDIACPGPGAMTENLSGGNQQKVILGRLLAARPRVLILDEPTRGIDVGAKFEIYRIMARLADEGTAVIFISSELNELLGLSDRLLVLHRGELRAIVDGDDATEENIMLHAT